VTGLNVLVVTNLYPNRRHFEEGTFVKDLREHLSSSGCNVDVVHYRRNFPAMYWETLLRRKQFDIIDAQFIVPAGLLGSLTPKFCPLVVTVHRWDILEFPNRWPTASLWTRFTLHRADGVIVVSKYIAREAAKYIDDMEKLHVIPNAVNTRLFSPSPNGENIRSRLGFSEDIFLIVSAGRLAPVKGHQYLLAALRKLIDTGCDVCLAIAGSGSYRASLNALAKSIGVSDKVCFMGPVHHDDLPDLYRASDLFALTSLVEGQSVAITEAMACGKPIICSDIPGNVDVVVSNFNGFRTPTGDVSGIASAIETLYRSKTLRAEFGANSRALALQKFSWDTKVKLLLDLYNSLPH
jgi:glycosyltransferase involved in cell wall biosynthesis